jgi:hypothetical protein
MESSPGGTDRRTLKATETDYIVTIWPACTVQIRWVVYWTLREVSRDNENSVY